MTRLALQELAAAKGAREPAIASSDLAAHRDCARAALELPALEGAVIDVHELRFGGDRTAIVRIEHDQICVSAELDGALAWEKIEQLGDLSAGDVNQGVQVYLPGLHAVGVEDVHAFLERRDDVELF